MKFLLINMILISTDIEIYCGSTEWKKKNDVSLCILKPILNFKTKVKVTAFELPGLGFVFFSRN